LRNYSFNALIEGLYSNELDLIITLKFDVDGRDKLQYEVIEQTRDHIVVHKDHRLAGAKYVKLSDFKDDTFMMVSTEDSEMSPKLILDGCKNCGFTPKVKFASSLQEEMLWVEAGVGVCMLDTRNSLYRNSTVRFLDVDQVSDPSLSLAWNVDNYNPMKDIFKDNFLKKHE
jgi:DNA-binding transcriptional LysR family regulator